VITRVVLAMLAVSLLKQCPRNSFPFTEKS